MDTTSLAQHASRRGFPATLFNLTPNDLAYWWEPGLPWALDNTEDLPLLNFMFADEAMAPRFSAGLTVGIALVTEVQDLRVGQAYLYSPIMAEVHAGIQAGRLVRITGTHLELAQDNSAAALHWPLPEEGYIFQVTHYVDCPGGQHSASAMGKICSPTVPAAPGQRVSESANELDPKQPYLLRLQANWMGPRYPSGARYVAHVVPSDRWSQATGVHAVELRDGQWLLARCIGLHSAALAYVFDATGQMGAIALMDIARLWKLGVADYLPEETEAEHLLVVQRPAY